jgi:hypothetical protein
VGLWYAIAQCLARLKFGCSYSKGLHRQVPQHQSLISLPPHCPRLHPSSSPACWRAIADAFTSLVVGEVIKLGYDL